MFGWVQSRGAEAVVTQVALRTARRLDQVDTDELLERIGSLREEVGRVRGLLGRETIPEVTLGALASALDHTARLITGEERTSWPAQAASAGLARRLG